MPTDACLFFYICTDCNARLRAVTWRLLRFLLVRNNEVSAYATGKFSANAIKEGNNS